MADNKDKIIDLISNFKFDKQLNKFQDVIQNAEVTSSMSKPFINNLKTPNSPGDLNTPKVTEIIPSLYPEISNFNTEIPKYPNTDFYSSYAEGNRLNIFYRLIFKPKFTDEELEWRNNYLFDRTNPRFTGKEDAGSLINDSVTINTDPLIFEEGPVAWPSYVKHIYYTPNTLYGTYVQVSKSTNLYLNYCFQYQNFASFFRTGYYVMYNAMSKIQSGMTINDVKNKFINKDMIYKKSYGQIETWFNNEEKIVHNFNVEDSQIKRIPVNEVQLTQFRYKDLFDYIPICMIPREYSVYEPLDIKYPDPRNCVMSNICYHKNNCHDFSCMEDNDTGMFYKAHAKHNENEPYYSFSRTQLLDINEFLNYN